MLRQVHEHVDAEVGDICGKVDDVGWCLVSRNLVCATGPITEEEPFRIEERSPNEHELNYTSFAQEVLSLVKLEAEPSSFDTAGRGFWHVAHRVSLVHEKRATRMDSHWIVRAQCGVLA